MAELKSEAIKEAPKPQLSGEQMAYITIPAEDLYDQIHPGVRLIGGTVKELRDGKWVDTQKGGNNIKFEPGKTYQVPAHVAAEVEDRLNRFHKEQIRLLRPKTDNKSISQVNSGSLWARNAAFGLEGGDEQLAKLADKGERVVTERWS